MAETFFEESSEQSKVKSALVSKYFWAWARIIIPQAKKGAGRIAYLDLFAGPGRYKDGTRSTPLLILEQAIEHSDMRKMLVTVFNDRDEDNSKSLETAISQLPGVETLKYQPIVRNKEVGTELVKMFEAKRLVPTLFFVDPWGYKGMSLRLVNAVIKDWACECIFFFNYNRVNMGLSNPLVEEHMNALFGRDRANALRTSFTKLSSQDRELAIVEELCRALNPDERRYVLPFCFKNERGTRTSHHLIFVSKSFLGYEIMKEIMAKESTSTDQGVPSFEYNPADARFPTLFELSRPLDELEAMLLDKFADMTLTMQDIYRRHSVGRRFIKRNYKEALSKLDVAGKIETSPGGAQRKKRKGIATFADHVQVTFPRRRC